MENNSYLYNALSELSKQGYKCYQISDADYGYIITPNDNVLYVQHEYFGGYNFSLQYSPSKACGTSCQCLEEAVFAVDLETVQRAEREGMMFAQRLRAPLFRSSAEWLKQYWAKNKLVEIAA